VSRDDRRVARHGEWPSRLDAATAAGGAVRFDGVGVSELDDGTVRVRWQESRPAERGRGVLCEWLGRPDEPGSARRRELLEPDRSVRSSVNEYGGGSWWSDGSATCFAVDAATQRVLRVDGSAVEVLGPEGPRTGSPERFAAGAVIPCEGRDAEFMVLERERPRSAPGEAHHDLVVVRTSGPWEPVSIVAGADFVVAPTVAPDGRTLAWLRWDHPDMPWDAAELWAARLVPGPAGPVAAEPRRVAGGRAAADLAVGGPRAVSVCLPRWDDDGVLWWCDDRDDWWHLRRAPAPGLPDEGAGDLVPLVWDRPEEVGEPRWISGGARYGWCSDGRVVAAAASGGRHMVWIAAPGEEPERLTGAEPTHVEHLAVSGRHVAMVAGEPTRPTSVWLVDADSGVALDLRGVDPPIGPTDVSVPVHVTFPTADGEVAHAAFHPPTSSSHRAPEGAVPPLVVRIHGGPTAATRAEFSPAVQFWTTRGIAVAEVDYRGSTGYGRRYRDLLRDRWGLADVEDCRAAAVWLAGQGLVDGAACVIRGGSAGGFTALAALVADGRSVRSGGDRVFAAACTLYGVTDLSALAADTHEFESRYLDGLVGAWPDAAEVYRERSPSAHVELIDVPVLILQGADDPVVPLAQAEALRDALASRGVPHACVVFTGEAHGFRQAANLVRALELELACYGEVLGFVPDPQPAEAVLARSTAVAPDRPDT